MEKTRVISMKCPIGIIETMDKDVEESGDFMNRSDWMVSAFREFIRIRNLSGGGETRKIVGIINRFVDILLQFGVGQKILCGCLLDDFLALSHLSCSQTALFSSNSLKKTSYCTLWFFSSCNNYYILDIAILLTEVFQK